MSLPNGEAGLTSGIQFGVSGDGSLAGVATRTQDNVSNVLKAGIQASPGWGNATSLLFGGLSPDGKTPFPVLFLKAILGALYTAINDVSAIEHGVATVIEDVLQDAEAVAEDVFGAFEALGSGLGKFLAGLLGLLGAPPAVNTGGTGTTPMTPATLQQFAGYLGSNTPIPANVLSTVAPGASPNVLADPGFRANFANGAPPFGNVLGHGQWFWDGFQGPTKPGSARTKRSGLVTVFWLTGTYQTNNTNTDVREYWLTPDASFIKDNSFAVSGEGFNQGIDARFFEFVPVFYGACMFPMKETIAQGTINLVQQIKATPGPFILTGWSQGAHVISNVYDLLRFGKYNDGGSSYSDASMMDRRGDLLAGIALGNPRRQQGFTFPGLADPVPANAGVNSVRLANCESLWWEMTAAGDPASSVPLTGQLGGWMRLLWNAIVERGNAGGGEYIAAIEDFLSSGDWVRLIELIVDPFEIPVFLQAVETFFQLGVHDSYWLAKPLAAHGDIRTFGAIACDYINTFAGKAHPPANGQARSFAGKPFAVQPEEVVVAGTSVMWQNVVAEGDVIILRVYAYDANNKLIGPVDAFDIDGNLIAAITDPEPTSNFEWLPLKAEFAMPEGAAMAHWVVDVLPEAMIFGKVWVGDAIYEVTNLFAGALIDSTTIGQLTASQVAGPLGEADMITAQLNWLSSLAAAASNTTITGAQATTALNAIAQMANNSQQALALAITSTQILSPGNRPHYETGGLVGDVTFPQSQYSGDLTTVSAGNAIAGWMTCQQAGAKTYIEFMAKNVGASTGVYINTYAVDPTTGALTNSWTSADVSASLPTGSAGWVPIFIPTGHAVSTTVAQLVVVEIVAQGTTITVGTANNNIPNKTSAVPPNWAGTRVTSSTGGASPSTLAQSAFSFGSIRPYILFGQSDVVPIYQAPSQWQQENAGLYHIPLTAKNGDFLDGFGWGAGGGGGPAHVGVTIPILNIALSPTSNGQGGQPGTSAAQTFVYGTDIPLAITELIGIVGAAGLTGTPGGDTLLGYGLVTPTFDAKGLDGATASGASINLTGTHVIASDANCLTVIVSAMYRTVAAGVKVKCGDQQLAILDAIDYYDANAESFRLYFYGLLKPPTGSQTITITAPNVNGVTYLAATSLSHKNVAAFGSLTLVKGVSTSASQTVSSDSSERIIQAFAGSGQSFSGYSQTQRTNVGGSAHNEPLVVGEAAGASSVNFAATAPTAHYGAIAMTLKPTLSTVLLRAAGGAFGGPAGKFNPANPNTTTTGIGTGDKKFAGRLYPGSDNVTVSAYPGNKPAGGGTGGNAGFPLGYPGADGMLSLTTRQGATGTISGGTSGGSGTELAVAYEATGLGSENVGQTSLSWTHASDGGPTCGVILIGAVKFTSGTVNISCFYGSTLMNRPLAGEQYFNSGGIGLFMFAFALIGPSSGSQTVTISTSGTATINQLSGNTFSYQNVGDFGNWYDSSGSGTALSLTGIPSMAGEMVIAGFAGAGSVLNAFNQTSRWSQTNLASIPMVVGDAVGGSAVNFSASTTASHSWGSVGGLILPVS